MSDQVCEDKKEIKAAYEDALRSSQYERKERVGHLEVVRFKDRTQVVFGWKRGIYSHVLNSSCEW